MDPKIKFTPGETYDYIKEFGLSVRQIPKDEPAFAGHWMCKQPEGNRVNVDWNIEKDNLAPTLEESVQMFVDTIDGNLV